MTRRRRSVLLALPIAMLACAEGRTQDVAGVPQAAEESGAPATKPPPGLGAPAPEPPAAEADPAAPPQPQGCGEVDYLGRCEGDVALYCHRGQLGRVDCSRWGQGCGWVDEQTGYYCGVEGGRPEASPEAPPAAEEEPPPPAEPPEPPPPAEESPPAAEPPPAPPPAEAPACEGVDYLGRCEGDVAVWCDEDGALQRLDCREARGVGCAWIDEDAGFFCGDGRGELPDDEAPRPPPPEPPPAPEEPPPEPPAPQGDDRCGGLDYLGACDGDTARWCDDGEPRAVDCAARGERCGYVDDQIGWYCGGAPEAPPEEDPCGGVDYLGRCEGDVAVWCDEGRLNRRDCGAEGQVCGWLDEDSGFWCQ